MRYRTELEQQNLSIDSVSNEEPNEGIPWIALAVGRFVRESSSLSLTPEEQICPSDDLLRQWIFSPAQLETSVKLWIIEHKSQCWECKQKVWRYYAEREYGDPEEGDRILREKFDLRKSPVWKRVQEILDAEDALKERMRQEGKEIFFFGQAHPHFRVITSEALALAADTTISRLPLPTEEIFVDDAYSIQVVTRLYVSGWKHWLTVRVQHPDGTWMDRKFHVDLCRVRGEKVLDIEVLMSKETTSDAYTSFDVNQLSPPSNEGEYCLVIYKQR